jgi:hypothetical protein
MNPSAETNETTWSSSKHDESTSSASAELRFRHERAMAERQQRHELMMLRTRSYHEVTMRREENYRADRDNDLALRRAVVEANARMVCGYLAAAAADTTAAVDEDDMDLIREGLGRNDAVLRHHEDGVRLENGPFARPFALSPPTLVPFSTRPFAGVAAPTAATVSDAWTTTGPDRFYDDDDDDDDNHGDDSSRCGGSNGECECPEPASSSERVPVTGVPPGYEIDVRSSSSSSSPKNETERDGRQNKRRRV